MSSQTEQHFYEFGPFRLDTLKRLLLRDGQIVPLTAKAFDTLATLVCHSGQDLDKDELMKTVWPDTVVEENNLTQNVSTLRKALGENKSEHRYIVTIPGRGYRFVAPVTEISDASPESGEEERRGDAATRRHGEEQRRGDAGTRGRGEEERPASSAIVASSVSVSPRPRVSASFPVPASFPVAASRLKIVAVVLLLVGLVAAAAYWWLAGRAQPAPPVSIAVLPFRPLGTAASDDYLGLGMAEALIIKLGNIRQISVRPASAVTMFGLGGSRVDPIAAGRELNVDWILEGTIQSAGERVHVTAQLVSVREGSPRWSGSFDERLTDILSLQDSISTKVAAALRLALTGEEQQKLKKRYTENNEANQSYMLGRFFWNKRDEESLQISIGHFNEAIKKDPQYALAYAGLADAYSVIGFYQFDSLPEESYKKAEAAARKALELDDTLAEAHASLALSVNDVYQDEARAELEFNRAIKLNPDYATAHHWYSDFLAATGRQPEAMAEIKRALELDPVSLVINATLGERFYDARRYDEAIEQLRTTLKMDDKFGPAHYLLGLALEQKKQYAEAVAELNRARLLTGNNPWMVAALGHALALNGKRGEAQRVLGELRDLNASRYVKPYDFAVVYQGLGQTEQVMEWLQKPGHDKTGQMLRNDPRMDSLQHDARFQKFFN